MSQRPTFFDESGATKVQIPGVSFGNPVEHLPEDVAKLYEEVRSVTSAGAYTSAVLGCRKLLMHIAVGKGATAGESFIRYIEYLDQNHFTPPGRTPWVDRIRQHGNEANHEIVMMTNDDAQDLVAFSEMLLKFVYEFPGKIAQPRVPRP